MISSLKTVQRLNKSFFFSRLIMVFMITCASQSFAQEDLTLSLLPSTQDASQNQNVNLTLSLSYPDGATASAFQLDINYDPDVLENPTATRGEVLINADKEISSSQPSSGVFRIVASGLNQNFIQEGNAATIGFHVKATAPLGQTDLILPDLDLAATDPDGLPLDPLGNGASVNVLAAVPTLSEWGIIILMTVMMGIGVMILHKRRIA